MKTRTKTRTKTQFVAVLLFAGVFAASAQTQTVTISDSHVYDPSGNLFNGTITLTPRSVTPAQTSLGPAQPLLYVTNGVLSTSSSTHTDPKLYPGTYSVVKKNSKGVTDSGLLWTVPATGPVAVWQIESRSVAAPSYSLNYGLLVGLSTGSIVYGTDAGSVQVPVAAVVPSSQPDLGVLGATANSEVLGWLFGLNDAGTTVGWASSPTGLTGIIRRADGTTTQSAATKWYDINAGGDVCGARLVGSYWSGIIRSHAGVETMVGVFGEVTYHNGHVWAMNASGASVGYVYDDGAHATAWQRSAAGVNALLDWGGTFNDATDINDTGYIVGFAASSTTAYSTYDAVIQSPADVATHLGHFSLGGFAGGALVAINASGVAVGTAYSSNGSVRHPVTRTLAGVVTDLGTFGTGLPLAMGRAINDAGDVLVNACDLTATICQPFIRLADGTKISLGSFGQATALMYALNNYGSVAGVAAAADGSSGNAILISPQVAQIPNASATQRGLTSQEDWVSSHLWTVVSTGAIQYAGKSATVIGSGGPAINATSTDGKTATLFAGDSGASQYGTGIIRNGSSVTPVGGFELGTQPNSSVILHIESSTNNGTQFIELGNAPICFATGGGATTNQRMCISGAGTVSIGNGGNAVYRCSGGSADGQIVWKAANCTTGGGSAVTTTLSLN